MDVWCWFDAIWGARSERHRHDFNTDAHREQLVALVGCEQPFHVVEGLGRGARHLLDAANHVLGGDRTDIDAATSGLRTELATAVRSEECRMQPAGALGPHAATR